MRRGLALAFLLSAAIPMVGCYLPNYPARYAGAVPLRIVNQMPFPVYTVNISPSSNSQWGGDWLGAATIAPGGYFDFGVQPGFYDVRANASNGVVMAEARGVDLRGPQQLIVTPAGFQGAGGYAQPQVQPQYGAQYPTQGGYAQPTAPPGYGTQGAVTVSAPPADQAPPPVQGAVVVNTPPPQGGGTVTPPPPGAPSYALTLHNSCPHTVPLFHGNGRPPFGSGTYGSIGANTTESFSGTQGEQFWITDDNRNGVSAFTPSGSQQMEIIDSCNGFAPP